MYNSRPGDTFTTGTIKQRLFGTAQPKARRFVLSTIARGIGLVTHGELFIRILTESSGRSRDFALEVVEEMRSSLNGQDIFDVELSDREAESVLAEVRKEKQLIVQWLLEGYYRALLKIRYPEGRA